MSGLSVFNKFLLRNSITPSAGLPLIHSTEAYILKKSIRDGILKTSICDTFHGEELLYFFVGRPAYKKEGADEAEYWELPSCIIFEFDVSDAKRIYPFDSGAFKRKRYPRYLSMMDIEEFEIEPSENNVKRAVGAFFKTSRDYYRLNPFSREHFEQIHEVDVIDEEILALHRLIGDRSKRSDDRRFSVEVQFAENFNFLKKKPIFAIFPENYLQSDTFINWVGKYSFPVDTYPYYPLRKDYYYAAIYEKLDNFYRKEGYYEV